MNRFVSRCIMCLWDVENVYFYLYFMWFSEVGALFRRFILIFKISSHPVHRKKNQKGCLTLRGKRPGELKHAQARNYYAWHHAKISLSICKICIYLLWNSRILTCVCAPETTWSHLRNRIQEPARAWSPSSESKSSWAVTAQDRQYLKIKMGIWCISPLFSFCIHVKGRNGWYYS